MSSHHVPNGSYSPYGDAERTGQEPLLVSEFGNWGLPKLPSELPWWFNNSFGEREVTRPEGVLAAFRRVPLRSHLQRFLRSRGSERNGTSSAP